ncbi:hypothetical protein [Kitasatospora aureofaciens]|uniref:hypothetical protein n=1 Tax=Kitasatospora aureofaciens TaxID=1894 RepID=UPI0005271C42|nr:hypothetical protein [Kitasatospora aureofaciens]
MDTDSTPAHSPTSGNSHWATGCGIMVTVLTALVVLAGVALGKFEDSLTQHGHLKDLSGSVAEPLRPGASAHYDDGLTITVSPPHREPDNSYSFTVTYDNGTDKELRPGGTSPDTSFGVSGSAPVVVRGGKPLDSDIPGYGVTVLDRAASASALMPALGEDQKRTVPVRVKPDKEGGFVTVEVTPQSAGYRETAYWQLDLG